MELRHLRYFAAVAQYLNYSEASRRLHVAQPAISQTILDLEDELGVKLLLRTKRSVQMTAAGSAFLREVQEILRRLPADRRSEFEEEVIYTDQLGIALPAAHPLAKQKIIRLKSLAGEPFVQFHRKGAPALFDEVVATCRRAGFSPRIVNEPNFMATVMTLVESGLGVSLAPRCVRSLNRSQVVIRPITPKSAPVPLCVAWRKSADNPALAAF